MSSVPDNLKLVRNDNTLSALLVSQLKEQLTREHIFLIKIKAAPVQNYNEHIHSRLKNIYE